MSLEPSRKFGLGDAITFGVAIFRASISARISPKNHRFWRAFSCNYLRRVDFFVVLFLREFRQKIIDLGVLFDAVNFFVPCTRELLFGPACQRGLRTRRYGR